MNDSCIFSFIFVCENNEFIPNNVYQFLSSIDSIAIKQPFNENETNNKNQQFIYILMYKCLTIIN